MPETFDQDEAYERKKRKQRARRIAEMKRKKQRQERMRRLFVLLCPIAFAALLAILLLIRFTRPHSIVEDVQNPAKAEVEQEQKTDDSADDSQETSPEAEEANTPVVDHTVYAAVETDSTVHILNEDELWSEYSVMVDLTTDTVLTEQNAYTKISPASMTKILTVLVAAEHIADWDDTFTITQEINDYVFTHDCSAVNFDNGEVVTLRDLFYGTALQSGADAALGLAYYVAGSQEAFVDLMNEKLNDLGLSSSAHFTNCIGLYDEDHYCTVYDMAMILSAAVHNERCREVLSEHIYTTSSTPEHPEGIEISNWFLRRIEDKDTHGEVVCAKTGYVDQSGFCAASYGIDDDEKGYIIVTGNAPGKWRCIEDHAALYQKYLK